MLPKINGKSFLEIDKTDLPILINNPDYGENEYLEYKTTFSFIDLPSGKERNEHLAEFKSDICSFANTEGGYLLYGISEEKGCAKEIIGITIKDTDRFELDRRSNLMSINPKTPFLKFHFVNLIDDKYVVVVYVRNDSFAPYLHLVDQKSYYAYSRNGNGKQAMTYTELKNKFNQSVMLEKEIFNYRSERISYFTSQYADDITSSGKFLLLHFIPETFTDASFNINPFVLSKIKRVDFDDIFVALHCGPIALPNVDGIKYISMSLDHKNYECSVMHNGVVECFVPLRHGDLLDKNSQGKVYLDWQSIWNKLKAVFGKYVTIFKSLISEKKVYIGLSLINCKDVIVVDEHAMEVVIDRNLIVANPTVIEDITKDDDYETNVKKLYAEFLLNIGIRLNPKLLEILKELYGD